MTATTDPGADPDVPPTDDIIVRTSGLSDAEIAAVVAVVRGILDEEIDERDGGTDAAAVAARRWRQAWQGSVVPQREWR
ncbi:MAG TPA: hypothetical protein VNQ48_05045 [Microbacteriaceae bacterium]|nr:hypothetical protein [Microbacteriaceae bacterium]